MKRAHLKILRRTMAPNVDPAILDALGLDPASTKLSSHGGSGFSSTFKLSSTVDSKPVNYFIKTGSGKDSEVMFRGEIPHVFTSFDPLQGQARSRVLTITQGSMRP